MIQQEFAGKAKKILQTDEAVIGLAVGGSWLTNELDEFSDLDLILITKEKITADKTKMLEYAKRLGDLLSGFTGEHVGEPRVLICLYDNPLLHVDIKFLTVGELDPRVETPVILFDKHNQLRDALERSTAKFPYPDFQWIEDRFWTWVHYALLKIGRGELMEAFDFFTDLRRMVLGPLEHIKNGNLPKGVRKVESLLAAEDFEKLKATLPSYDKASLIAALENAIALYQELRTALFNGAVLLQESTGKRVLKYLEEIKTAV